MIQLKFYFLRSYPVYLNSEYAGGQQYYATTTSNFPSSSSSSNGNTNSNSYIVPVDDAILNQSRGSPGLQTISSTVSVLFLFKITYDFLKIILWSS